MSKIEKIIDHLLSLGVAVFFENGKLKTLSDKEAMTPDVISVIQENKDEILRYLLESESDTCDELPKIPPLNLRKGCLSFSQQRLWLLEKIDGGGTHYNMSRVLQLSGCLNRKALEDALREIVRRHESLRTCFFDEDGIAVQVVQSVDGFKLDCSDLSCIANENKNTALLKTISAESSRAFNLESDLMLRAHLFKMESEHYVLLISMHHIASDGWSRNILIRELSALYTAYASGEASPLEDLDIQYLDYSHWQRNWFQGKGFDQQLEYWKKQLADLPIVHSFPLDRPRPLSQTFNGGSYTSLISADVTNRLNQLCREGNATLFMGLHAAFSVLLSRHSNETDIVVGTPVANREQEEVDGLIGFFVNNLVLRTNLSAEPTFRDLLDQSRGTLVDAFKNQQIPFEKIVETIQPERSLSHSPLFQIMLAMQFGIQDSIEIPGLSLSQIEYETGISNYDLTLNVMESQDGLLLSWEFNVDLFDSITIKRAADNFECLLNSLLSSPDKNVYEVDLISDREFRRQVIEWNDTKTDYSESLCIHELFERAAAEHPLSTALIFEEKAFTYNELNQKANQVAHYLIKQGINPSDLVGLCLERSPELIIGLLGILKAGAAYVPLDAEYPTERKQRIVKKAGVEHILVDECNASAFTRSLLVSDALTGFSTVNPVVKRASHELAYVIFTSGSTGEPKGVAIRHNSAVNLVSLINEKFNIGPRDRLLCITSIGFDLSVYDIFGALVAGATLVLSRQGDSLDPEKLVYLLKSQRVTFWDSVPSTLAMLIDYLDTFAADVVLRDLRLAFLSGDWIPVNLPVSAKKFFPDVQVVGLGGATEATVWSNYHLAQGDTTRYVSIPYGRPLDNNTFYVLNHRGRLAPLGVVGELYIGGVGVASGYLNDQEKTAHAFVDNPFHPDLHPKMYRTGDLGRLMSDEKGRPSEMQFIGRADSQVKIRGYRVELGEIKAALMESGPVADATVVARGNPKQLVAYVVVKDDVSTNEGKTPAIGDIKANLKQKLPGYMIPFLVELERIPLTANGKIDYQALPEPDVAPREIEYVEPSTDIEKILTEIWQTVLGLERVGVNDNFFELGGHSLLAVQAITRAKAAGLSIDVRQLFTQPTLLDLANDIATSSRVVEKALDVAPNLIPPGCGMITPDMLPLVSLTSQQIRSVADQVLGGMENIQDIYPLAPLQEGILFHHMMEDREDPYVLSALFQAKDKDVAESFIRALQFVVDRHDALRTAVVWKELPAPVQVVHRHCNLPVTWHEFNAEHDLQHQIQDLYQLNAQRMQISSPPLIRLHLFQDTLSEHCYLLMQLHHIASDHMGIEIIQREIVAYRRGEADALPPAAPYREFVAHLLYSDDKDNAKQFFSSMLGDVDEPTLPFDLTDIQGDGNGIVEQRHILTDNTATKVRLLAKRLKMSPAVLFHVAWALVVGRCCGKDDVVFGTVLSGRLNAVTDAENMLGMFINTLPIRVQFQGVTSIEMVHHVQQRLSQLLEFEHTPLATALSCSQLPSDVPLFSTLINYRHSLPNQVLSDEARGGDNDIQILREQERTNYPFTLCVDDYGDEFSLNIQVESSLDPHRVTGYMLAALEGLTDSLLAQPEKNVSDISILSRFEEHQLVESWNGIRDSYTANSCVHELFEEHVRRQPSREALVYGEERLTYGDLNRRANQLARYLLAHEKVTPDTLIGICLDRSVEMVVSILAVLKAGGAYLPLDPSYPVERLSYMLNDADLHTVITTVDLAAQLHLNDGRSLCLDDEEVSHPLSKELDENIMAGSLGLKPNHLAYVIYTSGSTGNPKGVMVEHRNITRLLDSTKNHFGFGYEDSWTLFHSFAFDFSVWELWGALGYGGKLVIVPYWISRSPGEFYELVAKEKITVLNQTPSAFSALISEDVKRDLPLSLRVIIFGGEALSNSSLEPWVKKYGVSMPELVNMYGITETTVHVTYRKITSDDIANGYAGSMIGTSLPDLDILVLNQNGELSPVGVTGEMYVGGAGLSRGYLNRDALTNERFPHLRKFGGRRYYRTGDLVKYHAEGDLEYKGRIDHQVKIRGFRVELGEIEAQLNKLNDVDGSIVLVQNTDFGEGKLIAYVASNTLNERQDDAALRQELSSHCRDVLTSRLPAHMIPDVFVMIRKMPLTPNGKIDRPALPKPELSWQQRQYAEPETEVERQLCEVWQSVLGIHRIGRNDNFFELGGNSLLVMQVMSQSYSKGFVVEARQIFQLPTVSALAPQVRKISTSDTASFVAPENLIPLGCDYITAEMLNLVELSDYEIEAIASYVPNGMRNIQDIYPLTPSQEGILFHHLMNNENDPYVLPMLFCVECKATLDKLILAINFIIARHDVLRTAVIWENVPNPIQVVYRNAELSVVWLTLEKNIDVVAQMHELASSESQWMDLRKAPLVHMKVAAVPDSEHFVFLLQMHHIIDDATSLKILMSEINKFVNGEENSIPPVVGAYRNFVAHTINLSKTLQPASFFRKMLGDVSHATLPFELNNIQGNGTQVLDYSEFVPSQVSLQLRELAKKFKLNPAALFHAAWAIVIARCSGREDIVFGTVLSGRLQGGVEGIDKMVGMFINTLPIRVNLEGKAVIDLVRQVQTTLNELLEYENASLVDAIRCSNLERDVPLFSALFNFRHLGGITDTEGGNLGGIASIGGQERTNYPLTMSVDDLDVDFNLNVQVDASISAKRVSDYMQTTLSRLVQALQSTPEILVDSLNILPESEVHQVLPELSGTNIECAENVCINEMFDYQSAKHPDKTTLGQGGVLDHQLNYWVTQLAGLPVIHSLPLDHPRPSIQTFVGSTYLSQVDTDTYNGLKEICLEHDATLFMGLHAAFSVLISRYSNEIDIVVGSLIANREQAEATGLINFFPNTLVLRSDLSESPSFITLLKQSKSTLVDAYAHQQVPFEQIVERLQPERSLSHNPLCQIMLVLQNNEQGIFELPELTLGSVDQSDARVAKYDFTLSVSESVQGLQLEWEYNTGLFEAATIMRMAGHFELLLKTLVTTPDENVFKVDMLSLQERHQLLIEWNDTATDYPKDKCIHDFFESQVEKNPDAVAVVFEGQQLKYGELNSKANQLAHYLINEKLVRPDTLVGICVERSLEMIIGILAILKAGAAYVPLDPEYPAARLAYMLEDANLTTVLMQSHLRATTPISDSQALCIDSEKVAQQLQLQSTQNPKPQQLGLTSNHLAYVIYTSGSTGNPKGVMIQHYNTVAFIMWAGSVYDHVQLHRVLASTSICFDLSVFEIFAPLSIGGGIYIVNNILDLISLKGTENISLINTVPSAVEVLLEGNHIPESVKTINLAGEPLKQKIVDQLYLLGISAVYDLYGPSEDTTYSTYALRIANGSNTIGKPIQNSQIYILNQKCQLVGQCIAGELYIGGMGLARGYLNRPDLTAEKFIPNPFYDKNNPASSERLYKTGDLVRWLPDGNLEFLGRIDHQVKIRGFRIELGEIENALRTHVDVKDTVVLARESTPETGDNRLVAYVVTKSVNLQEEGEVSFSERQCFIDSLRHHLNSILPDYMVPSAFVLLEQFPLTPNGKVDRKALPEPDIFAWHTIHILPISTVEKTLAKVWAKLLDLNEEKISRDANFFTLGGNSLLAIRLTSQLSHYGYKLTARQVMQFPILSDMASQSEILEIIAVDDTLLKTGNVPLLPNHAHSLLTSSEDRNAWNNLMLFELPLGWDFLILEMAFKVLVAHHDALRLSHSLSEDGVWKAKILQAPASGAFKIVNFKEVTDQCYVGEFNKISDDLFTSTNIETGPLMQMRVLDFGDEKNSQLLISINHYATDDSSNQILFGDFNSICKQLVQGQSARLPSGSSSYFDYAHYLNNYILSRECEVNLDYWLSEERFSAVDIPIDHDMMDRWDVWFYREFTDARKISTLSNLTTKHTNMDINLPSLLMSAFMRAYMLWSGKNFMHINLVDNGRFVPNDSLDVSRTVGWLSAMYPVVLTVVDNDNKSILESVSDQLNTVPKDKSCGLLRFCHPNLSIREKMNQIKEPKMIFNFLGHSYTNVSKNTNEDDGFSVLSLPEIKRGINNEQQKNTTIAPPEHYIIFNVSAQDDSVIANWSYVGELINDDTIVRLNKLFFEACEAMLNLSCEPSMATI